MNNKKSIDQYMQPKLIAFSSVNEIVEYAVKNKINVFVNNFQVYDITQQENMNFDI